MNGSQIVQMQDGLTFLGFRLVWKRKRGADKWYFLLGILQPGHRSSSCRTGFAPSPRASERTARPMASPDTITIGY